MRAASKFRHRGCFHLGQKNGRGGRGRNRVLGPSSTAAGSRHSGNAPNTRKQTTRFGTLLPRILGCACWRLTTSTSAAGHGRRNNFASRRALCAGYKSEPSQRPLTTTAPADTPRMTRTNAHPTLRSPHNAFRVLRRLWRQTVIVPACATR